MSSSDTNASDTNAGTRTGTGTATDIDTSGLAALWEGIDDPFLTGQYAPVLDELDRSDLIVTGELPAGLRGVFMRNGANQAFPPLGAYHVFDGDGMIHAVELDGEGGARYHNRWVRSSGLLAEFRRGRALFGGLSNFTFPEPEVLAEVGIFKNTANTNIVRHAGRYLALMEGAAPTEITRELATLGEYDFDGRLEGAMTAHPRWDAATGEMHFFGYGPFPPFLRYHVADAGGTLIHSTEVEIPRSVMIHDFVLTPHWAVFFDLPAVFDINAVGQAEGGGFIRWDGDLGGRIHLVPRPGNAASTVVTGDLDPFYVFHFLNAWEEDGRIVVIGCRAPSMPTSFGDEPAPTEMPRMWRWSIDPATGAVSDGPLDDRPTDFPRIDDAWTGLANRVGYSAHVATWTGEGAVFDGVIRWDLASGDSTTHVYGEGISAGEPVFAPDPDGSEEGDGWLLNFVTDLADNTTDLVVLDARDMAADPVARVRMPRRVPFCFHGNWMAD